MLAAAGKPASLAAIEDRLADGSGGVLVTDDATLSWSLENGCLHLYDIAGDGEACAALLAAADGVARERGAAIMAADVRDGDAVQGTLIARGFERDAEERDVIGGVLGTLVSYVRVV